VQVNWRLVFSAGCRSGGRQQQPSDRRSTRPSCSLCCRPQGSLCMIFACARRAGAWFYLPAACAAIDSKSLRQEIHARRAGRCAAGLRLAVNPTIVSSAAKYREIGSWATMNDQWIPIVLVKRWAGRTCRHQRVTWWEGLIHALGVGFLRKYKILLARAFLIAE
jgi:hypothetical protein